MPDVSVELNFFHMHYNDAKTFAAWAGERSNDGVHPSIYVRHAILSVVFASEALINRVLSELGHGPDLGKCLDKSGILDKWLLAPIVCAQTSPPVPFDRSGEPVQSFKELIQIRNWLAHPKVDNYFPATLDPSSSITDAMSEEYPWLEMLKGSEWKQTNIPKNPFEVTAEHAQIAITVLDKMVRALSSKLDGVIDDRWRSRITVRDVTGSHSYQAPVWSIWGGYNGGAS
jgi:hypothetical protein